MTTGGIAQRMIVYKTTMISYTVAIVGIVLVVSKEWLTSAPGLGTVLQVLGVALVPAGIISIVTEHFLRRDLMTQMALLFDDFLLGRVEDIQRTSQSVGVVHDSNPTAEICEAFAKAGKQILIYNGWVPDFEGLHRGLREAVQRNVEVKILLLNPDSPLCTLRAAEIGLPNPAMQRDYTAIDLDNMARFIEQIGGSGCVEIRLFDELPLAPIYATEEKMYVGWFYKARRAVTGPVIRVHGYNSPLHTAMRESFDRVWNNDKSTTYYPKALLPGGKVPGNPQKIN